MCDAAIIKPPNSCYVPGIGRSTSRIGLAADIGVIILLAEIEAEVVDNVSGVFNNIGTFLEILGSSIAADILKGGEVVGVSGRRETGEDTLLRQEEGAGADG